VPDHNYDHGSLYIEADGAGGVIAPLAPGPQPWGPGADRKIGTSRDQGTNWTKVKVRTSGSKTNHTYARKPVNAHPDFYALWAAGSRLEPTPSSLYFATQAGRVFPLPAHMTRATAKPVPVP
jgi:hypothetical protein